MSTRFLICAGHRILRIRSETAGRALTILYLYQQPLLQLIYTQNLIIYIAGHHSVGSASIIYLYYVFIGVFCMEHII